MRVTKWDWEISTFKLWHWSFLLPIIWDSTGTGKGLSDTNICNCNICGHWWWWWWGGWWFGGEEKSISNPIKWVRQANLASQLFNSPLLLSRWRAPVFGSKYRKFLAGNLMRSLYLYFTIIIFSLWLSATDLKFSLAPPTMPLLCTLSRTRFVCSKT